MRRPLEPSLVRRATGERLRTGGLGELAKPRTEARVRWRLAVTVERRAPLLLGVAEGGLRLRLVVVGHARILSCRPATTATQPLRFG
jgi:hypothetical protein